MAEFFFFGIQALILMVILILCGIFRELCGVRRELRNLTDAIRTDVN